MADEDYTDDTDDEREGDGQPDYQDKLTTSAAKAIFADREAEEVVKALQAKTIQFRDLGPGCHPHLISAYYGAAAACAQLAALILDGMEEDPDERDAPEQIDARVDTAFQALTNCVGHLENWRDMKIHMEFDTYTRKQAHKPSDN